MGSRPCSRRDLLRIGVVCAAAGPWLTACRPANVARADDGRVHLTVQPTGNALTNVHRELARRFMAASPDIVLTLQPTIDSYDDAAQRALLDAVSGQSPDVAFHGYNQVLTLAERGLPVPFDVADPHSVDTTTQTIRGLADVDGVSYGVPFVLSTPVIYFNTALVAAAGGDPARLPSTWDGIIRLGARIAQLRPGVQGAYFDYQADGNWTLTALIEGQGVRMLADDGKEIGLLGPAGRKALQIIYDFAASGAMLDMQRAQAFQAFVAGALGIIVASTASLNRWSEQVGGRFAIAAAPLPLSGVEPRIPAAGNAGMIFTRDPRKQMAARRYLQFIIAVEQQALIAGTTGYLPTNPRVLTDPRYLGDLYRSSSNHRVMAQQLAHVSRFFMFPGPHRMRIADYIRDELQSLVALDSEPDEVMGKLESNLPRMIASQSRISS